MNSVTTEPLRMEHVASIELRQHERELTDGLNFGFIIQNASALTLKAGETVIAIIGFYPIWKGVAEVFIVPSIHVCKYKKSFYKIVSQWLKTLFDSDLHRVQATAVRDELSYNFMAKLGFRYEGTMHAYTSNKDDYCMWARVK